VNCFKNYTAKISKFFDIQEYIVNFTFFIIKISDIMANILGLDLGTNSIGWAVVSKNEENKIEELKGLGSRIIPMSQDILGKFDSGNSISQTAERTGFRGVKKPTEYAGLRISSAYSLIVKSLSKIYGVKI
jgi:CRISPR/Cas system Type II protein with McrA/HNH and RuvC-like nuclease domain